LQKIQGTHKAKTAQSASHFLPIESVRVNLEVKATQPNERILNSLHLVFIPVHKNLAVKRA